MTSDESSAATPHPLNKAIAFLVKIALVAAFIGFWTWMIRWVISLV